MNEFFQTAMSQFSWSMLGPILVADILLSGDNAVVIAMAAKNLPPDQRKKAVFWGGGAAIAMRVVLTVLATFMLQLPYLKLVGGLALLWIAIGLLTDSDDEGTGKQANTLWQAIRIIMVADLVMSLDNVLAVAAASHGNTTMLIVGLLLSIPLIIFGSTMLLKIMDRFPIIVIAGAALLGWLSGEMFATDPSTREWVASYGHGLALGLQITCAVAVVAIAWYRNGRKLRWTASFTG